MHFLSITKATVNGAGLTHKIQKPEAASQLEKLEKRRMGLMLLTIAVATYLGSRVIVESSVPLMAFLSP